MKEAQDEFKRKGGNKRLNLSMSSLWFDQHMYITVQNPDTHEGGIKCYQVLRKQAKDIFVRTICSINIDSDRWLVQPFEIWKKWKHICPFISRKAAWCCRVAGPKLLLLFWTF